MSTRHIIGWEKNVPVSATLTPGATHIDTIACGVVLKDYAGNALTAKRAVHAYLSESSVGEGVSTTDLTTDMTASVGAVAIMEQYHQYILISNASGALTLSMGYTTGAKTFYLVLVMPSGELQVSGAIAFTA